VGAEEVNGRRYKLVRIDPNITLEELAAPVSSQALPAVFADTPVLRLSKARPRSFADDRDPTYDTNQDPVVRGTTGEIRKR